MRAVITGGAGFIGQSLMDAFSNAGMDVLVIDRADRLARLPELSPRMRSVAVSPEDVASWSTELADGDVLVQLACRTIPATSMESIAQDAQQNVVSAAQAFEAAAAAGVSRILFASSGGTVYGRVEQIPVDENQVGQPVSAYGASKLATEHYLAVVAASSALRGISLRLANPTGPAQFRDRGIGSIAAIVRAVHDGRPISIWGDGTVVRDFLDIRDTARAFVLAATSRDLASGSYNVGFGIGHSLNEVINEVFDVSGRTTQIVYTDARSFDVPQIALDSAKFREATGWEPNHDLSQIVAEMWSYLQQSP